MSQDVNLAEKQQFKMLLVFSPIFVADTKIIYRYDFVASLRFSDTLKLISMWTQPCKGMYL